MRFQESSEFTALNKNRNEIRHQNVRKEADLNRYQKVWLALAGFMGGIGFTMIAFHFNHKNILNESLHVWSAVFMVSLGFCVKVILKKEI